MIESAITQLEEQVANLTERLESLECLSGLHVMVEHTDERQMRCVLCDYMVEIEV